MAKKAPAKAKSTPAKTKASPAKAKPSPVKPKAAAKKTEPKKASAKKEEIKKSSAKEKEAPLVEAVVEVAAVEDAKSPKAPKAEKPKKLDKAAKKAAREHEAAMKILGEEQKRWTELKGKHGSVAAQAYSMSGVFEAEKPLQHKVLGWGFILSNFNDRLEVIFESGIKQLISNYKPSK